MKKILARINWRQIIIHALAFWFFMYSFETFTLLFFNHLVDVLQQSSSVEASMHSGKITSAELTNFLLSVNAAPLIGILTAFVISLLLSIKQKWFWLNSILTLLLVLFCLKYKLTGWEYIKDYCKYPGQQFNNIHVKLWVNGLLLFIPGILFFTLPVFNRFIRNGINKTSLPV